MPDEDHSKHPHNDVKLIIFQHVSDKIEPLREKIMKLEVESEHNKDKMSAMERRLDDSFAESKRVWKMFDAKLDELSLQLHKMLWTMTGVLGTVGVIWLFGKDIATLLIRIFGA